MPNCRQYVAGRKQNHCSPTDAGSQLHVVVDHITLSHSLDLPHTQPVAAGSLHPEAEIANNKHHYSIL